EGIKDQGFEKERGATDLGLAEPSFIAGPQDTQTRVGVRSTKTQDERTIVSAALKIRDTKRLRKGSHIFRGKGNKFKVRAITSESVAEAMSKVVERIGEYFVEFEVDIAVFLETRVSGPKADGIISKIGLDYSHRIKARGFAEGLWIFWKNSVQVQILQNDPQFVQCRLGKK
ncbi:hypothetical protein Gohar_015634, partial [Gossypium harknessii]|nr:hypothetical protein [Gossypium harknessii]